MPSLTRSDPVSDINDADDLDDLDEDEIPRKKFSGKKLVLFIFIPLLLLLGGGGAAYFLGVFEKGGEEAETAELEEAIVEPEGPGHFYDMPDMLINLSSTGRQPRFLKISISLELESAEQVPQVEANLPRVTDHFQTYLRELRFDDLQGSAGIYRLRQELLARVEASVAPVPVRDVLFRDILVQ